jgi:hypothetical protein
MLLALDEFSLPLFKNHFAKKSSSVVCGEGEGEEKIDKSQNCLFVLGSFAGDD